MKGVRPRPGRTAIIILVAVIVGAFFALDLPQYISLAQLQHGLSRLTVWRIEYPVGSALVFFLTYLTLASLPLPGAPILSIAGGALFGFWWGTLLVSFASSLGATIACALSRYLFHDFVRARRNDTIRRVLEGVEEECAYYLFGLRLVPIFPFAMINLAMGLTDLGLWKFYWVSQVGMLAGTAVYVNAGTQLSRITSADQIFSPAVLLSLVLLAVLPLGTHRARDALKRRRLYSPWSRPRRFDRNLIVMGGGAAGLVTAYVAAAAKAKVTLIEQHKLGGDCLNTGCVPSKALIRSAQVVAQMRRSRAFGLRPMTPEFEFSDIMERVQGVIRDVEPHDSVARYTSLGVEVIEGRGTLISPWEVEIDCNDGARRRVTGRSIVIAAGSRPSVPAVPGLDAIDYLTTDTVWGLRTLPRRLLVLGGGPIGCEMAQAFARLGSSVTVVEMATQLLNREDPEVAALIAERFRSEGIDVLVNHEAVRIERESPENGGNTCLVARHLGIDFRIPFDRVLVATGRAANLDGYGLEQLGIAHGRTLQTNAFLQTNYANIYAVGDVTGPYQFTHVAAHQAWYAAVNALFGPMLKFRADYSAIPCATFVDPEVARVGVNETEAKMQGIAHEITTCSFSELDRAIADGDRCGFVKVLTPQGSDRILGVTIVGRHAADLLAEFVLAMRHGLGLGKILGTVHIYPTMSEASKSVAGEWRRNHLPHRLLQWAERFHDWRRG